MSDLDRHLSAIAKGAGRLTAQPSVRSYVFGPTTYVKDLRTGQEAADIQGVLNGDLDDFLRANLAMRRRPPPLP